VALSPATVQTGLGDLELQPQYLSM
jgi:hypothetical protein